MTATTAGVHGQTADELRELIRKAGHDAKSALDGAIAEGRNVTAEEVQRYEDHMARAEGYSARLNKSRRRDDPATVAEFKEMVKDLSSGLVHGGTGGSYTPPSSRAARGKAWGAAVIRECSEKSGGLHFKGISPSGTVLVSVPAPEAVQLGQPVAMLRSLVPTVPTDAVFAYLRQDLRTNLAKPVAPGTLKPTSQYLFTRVQDRARTIAHLSTPLQRQDLMDSNILQDLISSEMLHGVEMSLEAQMINGDGAGENLLGMANTPGVQTVARAGADDYSLVRVLRSAITRLEGLGMAATGFVLHPVDYEALEAATLTDGSLAFTAGGTQALPLDRSARRAWGVPVVSSPGCPQGTAYCADFAGSTKLWSREEARIDWSENLYDPNLHGAGSGGDLFSSNLVIFRAEGRWGWGVTRPSGVVKIDLTPVP